ncbi:conserved hypothetical protein [Leishmania mexicana MHOM/GT/2001/U1103]|uniref:Uncharacterized protein n=1 Tax=Leishmania mexicana (strain MHOM/GT/2001/U1103) TaxID=929439 RepID=E9AUY1_LEIMU|nr:conserved hypothetical protein [Leishmania mexicana MHOM/GT/2001/U1103]CBZ26762.1 conserved hypothetical protein [Leishmania mexicana MHOM/GT/2001/U1103]
MRRYVRCAWVHRGGRWAITTLAKAAVASAAATPSLLVSSSVLTTSRHCTTTSASAEVPAQGDDGDALVPHLKQDMEALETLRSIAPVSSTEEIQAMIKSAKNAREVRMVLERIVYTHHLCFDLLNGHGYRVAVLQTLTAVAPHASCMYEWFDCVARFRRLGFTLTRTYAAEGFTTIRQWLSREFLHRGRSPSIVTGGTAHIKELMQWCLEDRLVFDHVLYTRIVFLLTMIVSYLDRQNLYRASFPEDFAKRDGIVVEWIVTNERCVDFDECVLQCDAVMEELLEQMRQDIPSRPPFSFMYRLADYYFATDNVEKMIAVMEDAESYGVSVAESTTAKLMQMACAFNSPQVPELLLRWRVLPPQCVLATPDVSRLLFFYSRSGGGLPCPHCGEPFNHRNVSVYCWLQTPPHQRQCPALRKARVQKGELEESQELPQNADWSAQAFGLFELSRARAIEWTAVEWRGFLLCCIFSPRAMEAKALMDQHLDVTEMDDFLRAACIRLLRHHAPAEAWPTLKKWKQRQCNMSPIALQEALMAASMVADAATRLEHIKAVWQLLLEKDSYVMPLTRRFYQRRMDELAKSYAAAAGGDEKSQDGLATEREEAQLMQKVVEMQPRHVSLLDMKDSAADFVVGTRRKNVYRPR